MKLRKIWARVQIGVRKLLGVRKKRKSPPKLGGKRRAKQITEAPSPQNPPFLEAAPSSSLELVPAFQAIEEFSGVQLSVHTQRAYKKDLQDFFAFLIAQDIRGDWAERVTPIVIAQYRMHLVRVRELSKGSVTRKLAVLKSFYKWASSRNWVRDNPAELVRGFPQTQDSKTGFLSDAEVDRLLGAFSKQGELGLSDLLARTATETLLMLGVRRSEACAIRAGDLELLEGSWTVRIRGKGGRDRVLPLPPRLQETWSVWFARVSTEAPLEPLFAQPAAWADWVRRNAEQPLLVSSRAKSFSTPLSSSELARIVRKWSRRAGLVNRVSPHMLRATAITHALDHGASHRGVQQMAGWTSPLMITRYDKRRNDPRHSAVLNLRYAQRAPAGAETVQVNS